MECRHITDWILSLVVVVVISEGDGNFVWFVLLRRRLLWTVSAGSFKSIVITEKSVRKRKPLTTLTSRAMKSMIRGWWWWWWWFSPTSGDWTAVSASYLLPSSDVLICFTLWACFSCCCRRTCSAQPSRCLSTKWRDERKGEDWGKGKADASQSASSYYDRANFAVIN